jgi:hypothetical protein
MRAYELVWMWLDYCPVKKKMKELPGPDQVDWFIFGEHDMVDALVEGKKEPKRKSSSLLLASSPPLSSTQL